ncbi:MAG TPA: CHAT domain-containing protein [Pyrinomonadaceae bacterium]|nr:CHAT domain-containing protein [Pyrinomonadaceae bacterium]
MNTTLHNASRRTATRLIGVGLFILSSLALLPIQTRSARENYSFPGVDNYPSSSAVVPQESTTLETGTNINRELKGGETHLFRLDLAPGQFLRVVVNQKGIDVTVTLFGPDGKQIAYVDNPNGKWGPEPVVAVAEISGAHRLEVRSPNKNADAGRYEIKVVDLREATARDKDLAAAERAFEQGRQKLYGQRTAASLREAIEDFKQALAIFESNQADNRQAMTLYVLGLSYYKSGEIQTAVAHFRRALPIFHAEGDRLGEANVLNYLGGASDIAGDLQAALRFYNQALEIFRAEKDYFSEAIMLNNIGKIFYDFADWQKALEYYSRALPLFGTVNNQRFAAITLRNIGSIHVYLGDASKALEYYQQALALQRAAGDKAGEAFTLTVIGFAQARLDNPQKALEFYNQALELHRATGDRRAEAITLGTIGATYSTIGDQQKGLEYNQQSLELIRAVGDRRYEAMALGNLGDAYVLSGQPQKGKDHYDPALAIFRSLDDRNSIARMLQGLARAERGLNNLNEARSRIQEALSEIEKVRSRIGSQQSRASYLATLQSAFTFYIDLMMQMHRLNPSQGNDAAALQINERARARSLLEMLTEARVNIREGVDAALLERERNLVQLLNAKAQRQVQLLGQKNPGAQLTALSKEISELEDQYQQAQAAIRKNSPGYAALTQPQPLGLKEIQQQLDDGTMLLEYSLGEERSYVWAVTRDSLKTYELPKREQIEKAARRVYDSLTARSKSIAGEDAQQKQKRIAQTDSQVIEAGKELSDMVLGPLGSELGAERLVVVADGALQYVPFAALPAPAKSLVVSNRLSAAKISTPSSGDVKTNNGPHTTAIYRFLIQDHEVISLPSASALAIQREGLRNRQPAPNAVAVIADPVFSASDERVGLPKVKAATQTQGDGSANTRLIEHLADDSGLIIRRLKFTRQEAEQILAEAPRGKNFRAIDFQANRAMATGGELSKYRFVHFATHGYIDSQRSDLSAIVLSLVDEQGKPQDGFLRTHDIYNLNLPAELVVLSACETGLGKEIKGEGLVGLTRGFMYAGARRVVVSLWNVNDKATAELMARFYRGMLRENKTPAAALRAAQMDMSRQKQWQSPYYWAPFVLQGEWK